MASKVISPTNQPIYQSFHPLTCLPADKLSVLQVVINEPCLEGLEVLADDRGVHPAAAGQRLHRNGPLLGEPQPQHVTDDGEKGGQGYQYCVCVLLISHRSKNNIPKEVGEKAERGISILCLF